VRLLVHLARLVGATLRFGRLGGRASVIVLVVVGLLLLAVATTAKVVAPLAVYPFA
jgi:hypothetical protein